jgi:tetratricopeptide (TPR) repeat protein
MAREVQEMTENLPEQPSGKFDLGSSLVFFIVKASHLHSMIPDHEIFACKEIFVNSACHESYFGLARLLAYQAQFEAAVEYLKLAFDNCPDPLYKQWLNSLNVKVSRCTENETVGTKSFFSRILCMGIIRNRTVEVDLNLKTVENFWAIMELSFKVDFLEVPEFYATKIIEIDKFYGYLAWSEVFFFRNDWQKGLDILKQLVLSHSKRPEGYIRLWYHYFYNVKDFDQAECIISEAFLLINSSDYHEYYILFNCFLAKTLFKLKRTSECLSCLQKKFIENPTYPVFLFLYGKYCVKSDDYNFNGTAIGALQECTRLCDPSRLGLIYYWLSKGYMQGRQHIEAYETVKQALACLSPSYTRKMNELRSWILDIQPSIEKVEKVEKILAGNLNAEGYKLCKSLCSQVKDLHKITVDVLLAKMLWKTGRHDEALKKLYAVSGISTVKMNAHFLLLEYLGMQNNLRCMKTVACEMVAKCKNYQVPAHVWVRVNHLYAKIMVKNNKPGKAILILKLIAKVLPPIPFASIQYTKFLQRAKDLQELANAHINCGESLNTYNFSSYKNSFIDSTFEVRDLSYKLIAEEAAAFPGMSLKFASRRSQRIVTERVSDTKVYCKKKTQDEKVIENEDRKEYSAISSGKEINFLSVCSDPLFLYKIGKIAVKHNVMLHDGVCAIKDFIELLKFEKDRAKAFASAQKAEKIYREICTKIKEY